MGTFRTLLIPPLEDERTRLRMQRWLTVVLVVQILCWTGALLTSPFFHIEVIALINLVVAIPGFILVRLGRLDPVRLGLPLVWYASFVAVAARGDGLHDLSIAAFPVLSIFPIVILGRFAAFWMTVLSAVTVFVFAFTLENDAYHPEIQFRVVEAALLSIVFFGTLSSLWMSRSFADDDVARARASEADARESKAALEAANTELLVQQAALAAGEERYRLLADNVHDVVWVVDLNFEQVYCSPSVKLQRGYTPEELAELPLDQQIAPEFIAPFVRAFEEEMRAEAEGRIRRDRMRTFQYKARCKDGSEIWLETIISALRDDNGVLTHFLGVARDISDRKRSEEEREILELQIQQMQKMESLGLLAGGIAHDFNNILLGVMGNADLALMKLPPNADGREHIELLIASAGRAADLCKQLLAYSGKGRFVVRALNLSDVVRDMTALLDVSIAKNVTMRYQLAENLPAVEADATQIRQIVMNLVLNAVDAVGERQGTVTVATGAKTFSHDDIAKLYLAEHLDEGAYVYVEVSDTGCGMDQDTQKRIFDPFFTTKPRGHGLGLAAVLGIVRGHGGGVKVYSEPGQGSCIRVYIPATDLAAEALMPERATQRTQKASGTILVVDDESTIRDFAKDALELQGYEVVTAENGRHAIEVFNQHNGDISVVLLDMTMPVMNGEETYRELRRIKPGVRAILSSGFNEQEAVSRFTGRGLAGFLQKPYLVSDLFAAVKNALNQPD